MEDRTERLTAINPNEWRYDPISRFWRAGSYIIRYTGWQYVAVNRETGARLAAGPTVASVMAAVAEIDQQRSTDA